MAELPILGPARRWLLLGLGGVVLASLAGALAPLGWPFELFVHFRVQYGVLAAVMAVALAGVRRPAAALAALVLAGIQLWPLAARLQSVEQPSPCGGEALTVATVNLNYLNDDRPALIEWLSREPADLVLLQELTPAWATSLEALPALPYRQFLPRTDPYGIGVLSRWPIEDAHARDYAADGLPSLVGVTGAADQRFSFAALHTHWPILPDLMRRRDQVLLKLTEEVRSRPGRWIVGGDLNLTAYSPVFRRFLSDAGLHDTRPPGAWAPSWLAGFWPLAMRIDHVLVTPAACVDSNEVGPEFGSDHRPVRVSLRWPAR